MSVLSAGEYAQAKALWAEGAPIAEIAASVGKTYNQVYGIAHWHREDFPIRPRRGGAKRFAAPGAVRAISCELRRKGMCFREIAEITGYTEATVRKWEKDCQRSMRRRQRAKRA